MILCLLWPNCVYLLVCFGVHGFGKLIELELGVGEKWELFVFIY